MTVTVVEPHKRLALRYDGKLCLLENQKDMFDPARAFECSPCGSAEIQLDFDRVSPSHGGKPVQADGRPIEQKAEESFARG